MESREVAGRKGRKGWRTTVTQMLLLIWDNRHRRRREIRHTATGRSSGIGLDRRHATHIVACILGWVSIRIMGTRLVCIVLRVIGRDGSIGWWMSSRGVSRVCELWLGRGCCSSWRRREFSGIWKVAAWRGDVFVVVRIVGTSAGVWRRRRVLFLTIAVVAVVMLWRHLFLIS